MNGIDNFTKPWFLILRNDKYSLDQDLFAEYIVQKYNLASVEGVIFIYEYEGVNWLWSIVSRQAVEKIIINEMRCLKEQIGEVKSNIKNNVYDFLLAHAENNVMKNKLHQKHAQEINLNDCILNIEEDTYRAYEKEDYKFHKLPYNQKVLAWNDHPEQWLAFLQEILDWHEDVSAIIDFIQEFIGFLFIPSTKYEKALLLYWSWANGKGVFLSVIKDVLWVENTSHIWLHEIKDDQALYSLFWKLANIDSDMQQNVQLDSWVIKKLVSGEVIKAKVVYKPPIEYAPYARLLVATNELPYLKTPDNSIKRRFVFVHLQKSFYGKENPELSSKLLKEKEQIFAWAIEWLRRLLKRGYFHVPEELQADMQRYVMESDSVEVFLTDDRVIQMSEAKVSLIDLNNAYRALCRENGMIPLSKRKLNNRLLSKWFRKDKVGGIWCMLWLRLDGEDFFWN